MKSVTVVKADEDNHPAPLIATLLSQTPASSKHPIGIGRGFFEGDVWRSSRHTVNPVSATVSASLKNLITVAIRIPLNPFRVPPDVDFSAGIQANLVSPESELKGIERWIHSVLQLVEDQDLRPPTDSPLDEIAVSLGEVLEILRTSRTRPRALPIDSGPEFGNSLGRVVESGHDNFPPGVF